jgi:hypothetical protein
VFTDPLGSIASIAANSTGQTLQVVYGFWHERVTVVIVWIGMLGNDESEELKTAIILDVSSM